MVEFDAVILMGGRAERLGGIAKGDLRVDGRTLLERAVDAAAGARHRVVVGHAGRSHLPEDVRVVREEPHFGGPVTAIAAGLAELDGMDGYPRLAGTRAVLLLAGDQPFAARAVPVLLEALDVLDSLDDALAADPADAIDAVRAVDQDGRAQHLLCVVHRPALDAALRAADDGRGLAGLAMRSILGRLRVHGVGVPAGATTDVDTWADAEALGATLDLTLRVDGDAVGAMPGQDGSTRS